MIAFGPVPSRRLGRSLGINNVFLRSCSYSCVYCQLGATTPTELGRRPFHPPGAVLAEVEARLAAASERGEAVDYVTFVPDGEPTLDLNLGRTIELLRRLGKPIAVLTNSSLLWREDVRAELMGADVVCVKADSVREAVFRRINRPNPRLSHAAVLEGILAFAREYTGRLLSETMLVEGLNDASEDIEQLGAFLARVNPAIAYLAVPTRPPVEAWVRGPGEQALSEAHVILARHVAKVELLIGYEGDAFASTGQFEDDLLDITAVHPMTFDQVRSLQLKTGADDSRLKALVEQGALVETHYGGKRFYARRVPRL
jgi:wyosine [tRNA(Phe)-imidazoG37] synthetase (radical SAM superfamily)